VNPAAVETRVAECVRYTAGVVRTQIRLTERQAHQLRGQARERGLSLAEIIRRYDRRIRG
jgi:hypothetical protein